MRWERLFADLQAQFDAQNQAALDAAISDLARAEAAAISLGDRLRAAVGSQVSVIQEHGERVSGELARAGSDWLLLRDGPRSVIIPHTAVLAVEGVGAAAVPAGPVGLTLTSALRALSRDRAHVSLRICSLSAGLSRMAGVIDGVGKDYLELALIRDGEFRRENNVGRRWEIPLSALLSLSSASSEQSF